MAKDKKNEESVKNKSNPFETEPVNSDSKKEKLYFLINRSNRTHECYVNRQLLRWGPNAHVPDQYPDGVPEDIINHKDFKTQSKYFTVTEIQGK